MRVSSESPGLYFFFGFTKLGSCSTGEAQRGGPRGAHQHAPEAGGGGGGGRTLEGEGAEGGRHQGGRGGGGMARGGAYRRSYPSGYLQEMLRCNI